MVKQYKKIGIQRENNLSDLSSPKDSLNNLLGKLISGGSVTFISEDLDAIRGIFSSNISNADYKKIVNSRVRTTNSQGQLVNYYPNITYQNRFDGLKVFGGEPRIFGGNGLTAKYYDEDQINPYSSNIFSGQPFQTDNFWELGNFSFRPKISPICPSLDGGIEWEGYFIPTSTENYVFRISSSGYYTFDFQTQGYTSGIGTYNEIARIGIAATVLGSGTVGNNSIAIGSTNTKYVAIGQTVSGSGIHTGSLVSDFTAGGNITLSPPVGFLSAIYSTFTNNNVTFIKNDAETSYLAYATYPLVAFNRYRIKFRYYTLQDSPPVPYRYINIGIDPYSDYLRYTYLYSLDYDFSEGAKGTINKFVDNSLNSSGGIVGSSTNSSEYISVKTSNVVDIRYQPKTTVSSIVSAAVTSKSTTNSNIVTIDNTTGIEIGNYIFGGGILDETRVSDIYRNSFILMDKNATLGIAATTFTFIDHRGFVKRAIGSVTSGGSITGTQITITPSSGQTYTVDGTSYPVMGTLYVPTSLTSSSIDVIVLYHGTITEGGTSTIAQAAQTSLDFFLDANEINIRDKIIFSAAYPQDHISNTRQYNLSGIGTENPAFLMGDNLPYARAALKWAKNSLNTFMAANGISKTIGNVYTFGHSQGGKLVTKMNTLETGVTKVIANSPGPIQFDQTCQIQPGSTSCTKIAARPGNVASTGNGSQPYQSIGLETYTTGHNAPLLFTQALDDDAGGGNQATWLQAYINSITAISANPNVQYVTIPTGGHPAFTTNSTLQTAIRTAVSSFPGGRETFTLSSGNTTNLRSGMIMIGAGVTVYTGITTTGSSSSFQISPPQTIGSGTTVYFYESKGLINNGLVAFCGNDIVSCLTASQSVNNGSTTIFANNVPGSIGGWSVQGLYFADETTITGSTATSITISSPTTANIPQGAVFTIADPNSGSRLLCCPPTDTSPPFNAILTGLETPSDASSIKIESGNLVFNSLTASIGIGSITSTTVNDTSNIRISIQTPATNTTSAGTATTTIFKILCSLQ